MTVPPSSCRIIAFPVERQAVFIRETARILDAKDGAAADRFFTQECRRLAARLQVQRVPACDIMEEVENFGVAINRELVRLNHARTGDNNPRGAA